MAENTAPSESETPRPGRTDRPAAVNKSATAPEKVERVLLVNKLAQPLKPTLKDDNGVREIEIGGYAVSEPVNQSELTPYTLGLVEQGHLKQRPVNP